MSTIEGSAYDTVSGDLFLLDASGGGSVAVIGHDGALLRTIGRPGEGPGEIVLHGGISATGQRMALVDNNYLVIADLRGVSVFDKSGKFIGGHRETKAPLRLIAQTYVTATGPRTALIAVANTYDFGDTVVARRASLSLYQVAIGHGAVTVSPMDARIGSAFRYTAGMNRAGSFLWSPYVPAEIGHLIGGANGGLFTLSQARFVICGWDSSGRVVRAFGVDAKRRAESTKSLEQYLAQQPELADPLPDGRNLATELRDHWPRFGPWYHDIRVGDRLTIARRFADRGVVMDVFIGESYSASVEEPTPFWGRGVLALVGDSLLRYGVDSTTGAPELTWMRWDPHTERRNK